MRDQIATAFEVFGLLFFAAAAGVLGAQVNLTTGLAAVGAALSVEAVLIGLAAPKAKTGDDE